MDADFLKELEDSFSNIGTDEVWKEPVGGRIVWLSPISFTGQGKVQEVLANKDLGANVIAETKRVTLAHAIVGIDSTDLRSYRGQGPVFGPIPLPGGKSLKVDLPTYVHHKMSTWGQQFIDDLFNVFADRLESHSKKNVKEVKFENAKNPVDELGELMVRVTELRLQLGYPPLVEKGEVDEAAEFERMAKAQAGEPEEPEEPEQDTAEPFDPFRPVRQDPPPPPAAVRRPTPAPEPVLSPPPAVPVPVPPSAPFQSRTAAISELETGQSSSSNPFVASPSASSDVIERPAARVQADLPVIDPVSASRNPRFNPPKR